MPQFYERPLDVAELLNGQRVRLDKTQENVTPDDYRRHMEERMRQSEEIAKRPTYSVDVKPKKLPSGWDYLAKAPGHVWRAFTEYLPKTPTVGHNYGGNPLASGVYNPVTGETMLPGSAKAPTQPPLSYRGHSIAEDVRRAGEYLAPMDLTKDATPGSQALHTALGLIPGVSALRAAAKGVKNTAKGLKAAVKARPKTLAELAEMNTPALLKPKPVPPKPKPSPFGELLGIADDGARGVAHGVAEGLNHASQPARRGFVSRTLTDPWFWMGGGNAAVSIGKQAIDSIMGAGALAKQTLDMPEERSSAAPPEAPAKPKDEPIKQEDFDGRKLFGPKGEVPGNDKRGNPVTKPTVPAGANEADSLGAQYLLNNDADFNATKAEYLTLKNKIRLLQERRLPLNAALSASDIERWNELNSREFKTPAGVSIFEGR